MVMNETLTDEARSRAEQVLLGNVGELGLLASRRAYQQVWARDSMVCGLALMLCQGAEGVQIHRRSLETLRKFQTPLGNMPHNVGYVNVHDPALVAHGGTLAARAGEGDVLRDTTHSGCVDNSMWYVIGHYASYRSTGDKTFLRDAWESLEKAMLWLRYQDSNECGLLEVHEAMDWSDLFANRYNILYDNVLYYASWKCMGQMADGLGLPSAQYHENAADVRRKINVLLWIGPEEPKDPDWIACERMEWLYTLRRVETELVERPFYLPYMAFREYADRFDTFGNLLAVLFGVADGRKADKILDYLHGCGLDQPFPVRALYPVIRLGDRDWRDYYRVRNLNVPHHYHNGGAWPFLGGFYVAALVQAGRMEQAREQLASLTEMNRRGRYGEWEFNEWFHGQSGRPMGFGQQSWSAGMYIYAHDAVNRGRVSLFEVHHGWTVD